MLRVKPSPAPDHKILESTDRTYSRAVNTPEEKSCYNPRNSDAETRLNSRRNYLRLLRYERIDRGSGTKQELEQ